MSETEHPSPAPGAPAGPALDGREYLRLVLIGVAIGIPAAVGAVAFQWVVHHLEVLLWDDLPRALGSETPPAWLVVALPVVGGLVTWGARTLLPGDGGHEPFLGISVAPMPLRYAPSIVLAALGSLAFGAVLGPEAPLIAIGGLAGMAAVKAWKVTGPSQQVLTTAGSFAALSALFGGPVVAGALLLEAGVAAGAALIPVLLPGAVAAAVGYLVIVGVGDWSGIPTGGLALTELPDYPNARIVDLLLAVVAGAVVALVVRVVRAVAIRIIDARPRFGVGPGLVGGGLLVGLLAVAVTAAGGTYSDVLFSGQYDLDELLVQESELILVLIILAKGLAYAICLGVGFRGGPIFPSIMLGVAITLLLGGLIGASDTVALAIGVAAGMAAFSRLVFSSLVFVLLLTGGVSAAAMPAAVLAAVTAWLVMKALDAKRPEVVPVLH